MNKTIVKADFSKPNGKPVYPLHGVNAGPMTKVFTYDARPQFCEAGFPYARLHDTEYPYGSGEFVDIPCIFKNFDADENDPASYNFALTDLYIEKILEVGCKPLFRLGVSIEHAPVKRHVFPPKDFAKWARICEHIIRHYNEGWADGHHWNMEYWEIWNEADGKSGNMWQGTPEQFYEFYTVAARHLKACFPHLKIGGPAFTTSKNDFAVGFFAYLSAQSPRVPLDFYSWHCYYADMDKLIQAEHEANEILAQYGYADAESVLDEWNYMEDWNFQPPSYPRIKTHIGAAHAAATMAFLQQDSNVKLATYFEADVVKEWCGVFDVAEMSIGSHGRKATMKPLKPYYSFLAFNKLYKLGSAVDAICTGDTEHTFACAAAKEGSVALLASNYNGEDQNLQFDLCGVSGEVAFRVTDTDKTFETVLTAATSNGRLSVTLPVKKDSVVFIESV